MQSHDSQHAHDRQHALPTADQVLFTRLSDLVTAADRPAAARTLAALLGAETCVIFVRDTEVDLLLPAPGFPQTLPGWQAWQTLLSASVLDGQAHATVPYPTTSKACPALGLAASRDAVCVLLGVVESPSPGLSAAREALCHLLPMLAAALAGERAAALARAHAELARSVAEESRALAHVLDDARRALQAALAEAEAQRLRVFAQSAELDAIVQALPDALVVYSSEGVVVRANDSARALYAEVVGKAHDAAAEAGEVEWDLARALWPSVTPGDADRDADAPAQRSIVWQALHGASDMDHIILSHGSKTALPRHLMAHASPIAAPDGRLSGAVLVVTDVTMLYALDQHKEAFLGIVAHELRTPLTTLKLMTQLLARAPQDADARQRHVVRRIGEVSQRMERLVNDLFDSSRIQSGQLEMRFERCDVVALCANACEERQAVTGRTIALEHVGEKQTLWVHGDEDRLSQVLDNLLANAVKYSPADAPVVVRLLCEEQQVRVEVCDAGPGLAPHVRGRVFERYFRDPTTPITQGSHVGLGLGLYIAKNIVERHGGAIGVESAPNEGSAFWFTLPLITSDERSRED